MLLEKKKEKCTGVCLIHNGFLFLLLFLLIQRIHRPTCTTSHHVTILDKPVMRIAVVLPRTTSVRSTASVVWTVSSFLIMYYIFRLTALRLFYVYLLNLN